jgi:hypothetical protein
MCHAVACRLSRNLRALFGTSRQTLSVIFLQCSAGIHVWGSRDPFRVISHPPVFSCLRFTCAPCVFLCCVWFVTSIVRNALSFGGLHIFGR